MRTRQRLYRDIKVFLRTYKMTPVTFGKYAADNSRLVKVLAGGGDIYTGTMDRVRDYMRAERRKRRVTRTTDSRPASRRGR